MSIGNRKTPIMKGEPIKPDADPTALKTFSTIDSVNNLRMIKQKGIRAKATFVNATENNVREIRLGSPFLATTAANSLKKYPK